MSKRGVINVDLNAWYNSDVQAFLLTKRLDIGDEGAERLARALPSCAVLVTLILQENGIGIEGAKSLAAVLPRCVQLQNGSCSATSAEQDWN